MPTVLCNTCGTIPFKNSRLLPDDVQINRLRDILRSNTWPPVSLRRIIDRSSFELDRYDSEIQRLQEIMAKLSSDRALVESYADVCRSIFSPVRRLPTELLIEIFEMCAPPGADQISDQTTPKQEFERVSKKYLLQLSQVCSHWYGVVMGAPTLWSTIVVDTTRWMRSTGMRIHHVTTSLERSGNHPLTIKVAVESGNSEELVVLSQLLAHHSPRWRNVSIWNNRPSLELFAAAKGNLPLLENLSINNWKIDWQEGGIFEVAPRLTTVTFTGRLANVPTLPWRQIQTFTYDNLMTPDPAGELALLRRFSAPTRCQLLLYVSNIVLPIRWPPVLSNVSALSLTFSVGVSQQHASDVLGAVFECLTLPCLGTLELTGKSSTLPLSWHQPHFLTFASRSGLHASLTRLDIRVLIQDEELLHCLSVLPSLEQLVISGCENESRALVTDTLLRGLAWRDDETCLVPRLKSFSTTSLLQFTDDAYWDFVISRLIPPRYGGVPFKIEIHCLPEAKRRLSIEFLAQILELESEGDLSFTFAEVCP